MIVGMTTGKIAITVPQEQVAAQGRARSGSAHLADSPARRDADEKVACMLAAIFAEQGHATDDGRAWARRALGPRR